MQKFSTRTRLFIAIFVILLSVVASQLWPYEPEILNVNGAKVQVIDGDSFKTASEEFRLYGIDAPEYRQRCKDETGKDWDCGKVARAGLERLLGVDRHICEVSARDQYQRAISTCTDPSGKDLGAELVRLGLAQTAESFGDPVYAKEEGLAKRAKRGIWKGSFTSPRIWRAENPR
ncbi:MAG: thermonuclease family protein [Parasphingorhabdus sp.]|uniref:thermonuclease family protein n=1 Tax=Parasphingorhabdus sp. TaxID=2709688 RepID=UPI0032633C0D